MGMGTRTGAAAKSGGAQPPGVTDHLVSEADPEEVFGAIANGTRLAILRTLWASDEPTMTFSELRTAVGMRDSGQFNYHLDALGDRFVTKTDEGYRLTQAGKHVNGAIASGVYTSRGTVDPISLNHPCRVCGGDLTLRYEEETARITCESCSAGWEAAVPPAALAGHAREDLPHAVSDYVRTRFQQVISGFCTYCEGKVTARVGPIDAMEVGQAPPATNDDRAPGPFPVVQFDCQRCNAVYGISVDHALVFAEPLVACFLRDHGIDPRERPIWSISELVSSTAEIVSRDPVRARVRFRADGSDLAVHVDETFDTIEIDR